MVAVGFSWSLLFSVVPFGQLIDLGYQTFHIVTLASLDLHSPLSAEYSSQILYYALNGTGNAMGIKYSDNSEDHHYNDIVDQNGW